MILTLLFLFAAPYLWHVASNAGLLALSYELGYSCPPSFTSLTCTERRDRV